MINWFDMPAEGLSNGGLFEVKELEVTENGTYETKGEMYNKVTVNVEGGGGGSSDFSTAEVTAGIGVAMDAPVVINEEDFQGIAMIGSPMEEETMWQVPLYKGKCTVSIYALEEGQTISVSGDITEINEGVYLITGDCTLTISE